MGPFPLSVGDTSGHNSLGLRTSLGSSGWVWGAGSTTGRPHQKRPDSFQKLRLSFCSLYLFAQNLLPSLTFIFSPAYFSCILLLEEKFVQVGALQHCGRGGPGPSLSLALCPPPPPLYSYSEGSKISSSEASYAGQGLQTIAYTSLTVPRTCRDLGHSLPEWVELFEPSQPCFELLELRRHKFNQKVKQTGAKKENYQQPFSHLKSPEPNQGVGNKKQCDRHPAVSTTRGVGTLSTLWPDPETHYSHPVSHKLHSPHPVGSRQARNLCFCSFLPLLQQGPK